MEITRGFVAIPAICFACLRSLAPPVRRSVQTQALPQRPPRSILAPRYPIRSFHNTTRSLVKNPTDASHTSDRDGTRSLSMETTESEDMHGEFTGSSREKLAPSPTVGEALHPYSNSDFPRSASNLMTDSNPRRRRNAPRTRNAPASQRLSSSDTSTPLPRTTDSDANASNLQVPISDHINPQTLIDEQEHLGDSRPSKRLWIGNVFHEVDSQTISDLFSQFGHVVNAKVYLTAQGSSKGWASIEFSSLDAARNAKDAMHKAWFLGCKLNIRYNNHPLMVSAPPRHHPEAPTTSLYIGRIPFQMSDAALNEFLRNLRNVIDLRVAFDRRTGQPKGYAYCEFIDVESAQAAKTEIEAKTFFGLKVVVSFIESQIGGRRQRRAWERARKQSTLPPPGMNPAARN